MTFDLDRFAGVSVLVTPLATTDGPAVRVRRAWRERLLSRPWRPWRATRVEIPRVPAYFYFGGKLLVHPAIWADVRRASGISYGSDGGASFVIPPRENS